LQNDAHAPTPRAIEVELGPLAGSPFAARVRLRGEHDLATSRELIDALAPLYGDVLVDLSACEFIDSTIIAALLASARDREREGQRLELLVPAENGVIVRTLEIAGVSGLLTIRPSMP
jgi:anti-anti-sigma factor